MLPRLLLTAIASLLLVTARAAAQPQWSYLGGPSGARITSLVRDAKGNLYAAAIAGWSHDRSPQGKGLYRSTDDGLSWNHVAFRGQTVRQLGVAHDGTLYALLSSKTGNDGDSVATSRDGIDWTTRTLGRVNIERIATEGTTVHMIMRDLGVLSSTDGTYPYPRHNPWSQTRGTTTIALSPGGTLLNGCATCRSVIISDSGRAWTEGTLTGARWLAHDGKRTFYAHCGDAFRLSIDDGETWQALPPAPAEMTRFIVDARFGLLGIGADRVILYSADLGRSWTRIEAAKKIDAEITDAIFTRNGEIFIGTKTRGLFRRTASGEWAPIGDEIRNVSSTSITIAPDGSLLVGSEGGIYRSADGGRTWSGREAQLPFWSGDDIKRTTGSFYNRADGSILVPFGNLILRSSDNGASWRQHGHVSSTEIQSLAVTNSDRYYVVPKYKEIIEFDKEKLIGYDRLRVNIGGRNDETGFSTFYVHGDRLYAISQWRVFLSLDRGSTWKLLPVEPENTNPGPSALLDDGTLLLTNYCGRLYRLPEDGEAWEQIGVLPDQITRIIQVRDGTLLAIAAGRVVRSLDGGERWVEIESGIENEWVTDITSAPDGQLYVATASGVFSCPARSAFSRTSADRTAIRPQFEITPDSVAVTFRLPFTSISWLNTHRNGSTSSNGWNSLSKHGDADGLNRIAISLHNYPAGEYMAYFAVGCTAVDSVAFTAPERRR